MSTTLFVAIIAVVLSTLALLGGLVSVWVGTNVKIAKIETTVNLKIAALEMSIASYIKSNTDNMHCSFADNKEEHKSLMTDVKEIRASVNQIGLEIAKLSK
jgi:outer membrane murein-binding lipoprotein Lpp